MAITMGGITIDKWITPPEIKNVLRARSVLYSLNGTAKEDRLGGTKLQLKLTFGWIGESLWNNLKTVLSGKNISINGSVGSTSISGTYLLVDEAVPTPIMAVIGGSYVCNPFSITLEEV
ncbi:MAG: hypothetical protein ACI4J7_08690 [Ruminiclostridium sp.]